MDIYLITNHLNGKTYVGQTERGLEKRFQEHCSSGRVGLGVAIQKHGRENFSITLLETTDGASANERETFWIKETNSYEMGYNLCPEGNSTLNTKTPETRAKIREAALRRVANGWVSPTLGGHSEETKAKMRGKRKTNGHRGMKRSDESRRRMSEAAKGKRLGNKNARRVPVTIAGVHYSTITEAARALNVHRKTAARWAKQGR